MRWHEREDRAGIEAAREKAEAATARRRAEDAFLAAAQQARAARAEEQRRWAAAEKAVMAEEFAAALGAAEVRPFERPTLWVERLQVFVCGGESIRGCRVYREREREVMGLLLELYNTI